MRLWDWALAAYARPGVEAACLALQDQHGQCVSLLLWATWAAAEGRSLDAPALARAADMARAWEASVVGPLRAVRRELRAQTTGIDAEGHADLRERIKADELAAERLLLDALEAMTPVDQVADDPRRALRAAAEAWGARPPDTALDALANAFAGP